MNLTVSSSQAVRRAAACLGLFALPASAQDIAPFRLTGVEGALSTRYLADDFNTRQSANGLSTQSRQSQSMWRTELNLMAHGYVYHPKFLTLDIGGGPVLDRQTLTNDTGSIASQAALYNFSGRATFFKDMPLHGSAYLDHLSPTVTLAPGEVMTQATDRYGWEVASSGPKVGWPARLSYARQTSDGASSQRLVHDQTEQVGLSLGRSYGAMGSTQFQLQRADQASHSGSLSLPIQTATARSTAMTLDTRLQLGKAQQYDVTHLVTLNARDYAIGGVLQPPQEEWMTLLSVFARHTPRLTSYSNTQFSSSRQGSIETRSQSMGSGGTYTPDDTLSLSGNTRFDKTENLQYVLTTKAFEGNVRKEFDPGVGKLQASALMRLEMRDQQAFQPQANVIDESIVLSGLAYQVLARRNVLPNSVTVTNLNKTQTYVLNVDYQLSVLGDQTRIVRLIGGAILDNEEVLVSYQFDTGGSYALEQVDQAMNLNWSVSRYLSSYYRRFSSTPKLTAGNPTYPLNAVTSDIYGANVVLPLSLGAAFSLGGNVEHENRRETLAPYLRQSNDIYLQTEESLYGLGNLRLSARRMRVDYQSGGQNMEMSGYDLRYWARPWYGMDVSVTRSVEQDSIGGLPQQRRVDSLNAQWKERKLTVTARYTHSRESQQGFERERSLLQLIGIREF